jgi:uncharacterized OB-fold protein
MIERSASSTGTEAVPLQPGLFEADPSGAVRLVASRCQECGAHFFPRRLVCAGCLSNRLNSVPLSARGTLYTYTTIYQSTPEFQTPYMLAYVDLPEGVRLLAQLMETPPDAVRIGMALELRVEPVRTSAEGRPLLGYRLYPVAEATRG